MTCDPNIQKISLKRYTQDLRIYDAYVKGQTNRLFLFFRTSGYDVGFDCCLFGVFEVLLLLLLDSRISHEAVSHLQSLDTR